MQHGQTSRGILPLATMAALLALAAASVQGAAADTDAARSAHNTVRCGDCHAVGAMVRDGGPAGTVISRRCADCHGDVSRVDGAAKAFHGRRGGACSTCHAFHEPDTVRAGDREFSLQFGDANTQAHCAACHQPGVALGPVDAAHRVAAEEIYHRDDRGLDQLTPSQGCLTCHGTGNTTVAMPTGMPEILRINPHATHPFGIRFRPGQGRGDGVIRTTIDPRLPLPDGRIECVTCHSIPGGTKDLLVPFDDPYALCLGCHQVGDQKRDQAALALAGDH